VARRRNNAVAEAAAVLAALTFAGIAGVAGFVLGRETGGGREQVRAAETTEETTQTETAGTTETGETETATTGTGETGATTATTGTTDAGATTGTGGDAEEGDAEAGQSVFASAGCGNCHALEAAGATGTVGPNLAETDLNEDEIRAVVTNGRGGMPSFRDQLSPQQIADVAAFVHDSRE
jgi:mono/diheme cytochrome c family protein